MKLDIQLFAVSKSTTFAESNLDVVNNTSTLKITIYFSANNTSTWFSSETLYCTCNGVQQSAKVAHPKGGSTTKTFTFNNIAHNADGTKTVSWSWSCATGTSVLGTVSASGTKALTNLHKPPEISAYTITETNQALIDAGISNDMFVANLSQKSVNISYTLYDNATLTRATAFDHTTPYSNTALPITMDFTQNPLVLAPRIDTGVIGLPFLVRIEDSLNGLRFFTNTYGNFSSSPSSGEYRDFYNYISYVPVSFTSTTKAKRVGQLSGQVALDIEGVYFNGAIGNVNQGVTYGETQDTEFLDNKNYYMLDNTYVLLQSGVDYQVGDDIETYFTTVYELGTGAYKPVIKYKYWKYGDAEPVSYSETISASDISVTNGIFSVSSLNIGSTTETDLNYFNPSFAYRIKLYVEDNFTNAISNELSITIGEATWTEYKDRVDFKKITIQGEEVAYGDTGWQSFSWTNSTYVGTSQSAYTLNKWRVKSGILYVMVGAGKTSTINTTSEDEIARIPITGNTSFTNDRIWIGAIGGGGAVAGFSLKQNQDYISINIKPHTTSSFPSAGWFSTYFTVPLDDTAVITLGGN